MKLKVLSNGQMLIGLDQYAQVYDFHFPYVGLENHSGGKYVHKIGIFVDNQMSWMDNGDWEILIDRKNKIQPIVCKNQRLGIEVVFEDVVYNEKNIFLRQVKVINHRNERLDIRLYFNAQYEIYESYRGDTAYYDASLNSIIHYKGRRVFLHSLNIDGENKISDFSVGLLGIEGREGTYIDAEDGALSKNPVEHGLVDSVAGSYFFVEANSSKTLQYYITVGKTLEEVEELHEFVCSHTPERILETTTNYWYAWQNLHSSVLDGIKEQWIDLYHESLKVIKNHVDATGGIVASSDTSLLKYGRDSYSYVWHRDAALISMSMLDAGYFDIAKNFLKFSTNVINKKGYFMHKYRSDGSIGSSWHPWIQNGISSLPIQFDETALVVCLVEKYFSKTKDLEFIEEIYNQLIKLPLEFLESCICTEERLVLQSYDLWEENYASGTFTASTIYAAFIAGAKLAGILGKTEKQTRYSNTARIVKDIILQKHVNMPQPLIYKNIKYLEKEIVGKDSTIDVSSLYGLYKFNLLQESELQLFLDIYSQKLSHNSDLGIARYQGDRYFKNQQSDFPNPWIITTLWIAQMEISLSKNLADLQKVEKRIQWVVDQSIQNGILSEQIDLITHRPLSATPLVWSHAEYVSTILEYKNKFDLLSK